MKKILTFLILITCFCVLSCDEEQVTPKNNACCGDDWESPVGP